MKTALPSFHQAKRFTLSSNDFSGEKGEVISP